MSEGGAEEVALAAQAAQEAFAKWSKTTVGERSRILRNIGDEIVGTKNSIRAIECERQRFNTVTVTIGDNCAGFTYL